MQSNHILQIFQIIKGVIHCLKNKKKIKYTDTLLHALTTAFSCKVCTL